MSFLNEYGTCEYGQAAAFGRKCDKPCHGVKYHECECVSQERARNAMMALKNGLAIAGGIVTGIAAIGLISCLAAQRKSNVFMGAAFGPGTHQQPTSRAGAAVLDGRRRHRDHLGGADGLHAATDACARRGAHDCRRRTGKARRRAPTFALKHLKSLEQRWSHSYVTLFD